MDEMMAAEFLPGEEPPPDLSLESLMEIVNAAPDPGRSFRSKKDRKCRFSPLLSVVAIGLNVVAAIIVWTVASGGHQPQRASAVSVQRDALEEPITTAVPPAGQIPGPQNGRAGKQAVRQCRHKGRVGTRDRLTRGNTNPERPAVAAHGAVGSTQTRNWRS